MVHRRTQSWCAELRGRRRAAHTSTSLSSERAASLTRRNSPAQPRLPIVTRKPGKRVRKGNVIGWLSVGQNVRVFAVSRWDVHIAAPTRSSHLRLLLLSAGKYVQTVSNPPTSGRRVSHCYSLCVSSRPWLDPCWTVCYWIASRGIVDLLLTTIMRGN